MASSTITHRYPDDDEQGLETQIVSSPWFLFFYHLPSDSPPPQRRRAGLDRSMGLETSASPASSVRFFIVVYILYWMFFTSLRVRANGHLHHNTPISGRQRTGIRDADRLESQFFSYSWSKYCLHHPWCNIARAAAILDSFMMIPLCSALLLLLVACIVPLND